jgi:carbonic anhydrase
MRRLLLASCLLLIFSAVASAQEKTRILVVYHSVTGNTEKMAFAAAEGAQRADAVVVTKKVADVTRADLEHTDALIIGSPTQWSNMTAAMKAFIETWPDMVDKVGGAFATGGAASGGKEHVVTSLVSAMLSHGMIVAGPVYAEGTFRFGASGATATTGPGNEGVSDAELNEARELGKRVAAVASQLRTEEHAQADAGVCETGHEQSPIDIGRSTLARLPALQFRYRPASVTVSNSGHAVTATLRDTSVLRIGDVDYRLLQFHYHHPAEHLVDGKAAPIEVHLVHQNARGQLAVMGVLFSEGKANEALTSLVRGVGSTATIDPRGLLPPRKVYTTYAGSLTTPPCTEDVKWMIFEQPMTASREQMEQMRSLVPSNARPIQARGARKVEKSGL